MIALFLNHFSNETERLKFINLYNTYKNLLYWIAFSKLNNVEDAEECVQETFFYVSEHFDKIGLVEDNTTKCYLATIVTGFAVDLYNKSKKANKILYDDNDLNFENNSTDIKYFDNFGTIELLSVFNKVLDDESKVYFYLKYIYGYTSKEIADMYKVKDSYIRKKLQYAKEKLRKSLEGDI